jgi:hypothetical protein
VVVAGFDYRRHAVKAVWVYNFFCFAAPCICINFAAVRLQTVGKSNGLCCALRDSDFKNALMVAGASGVIAFAGFKLFHFRSP